MGVNCGSLGSVAMFIYLDQFWFEKSHVEMSHHTSIRRIMNSMRMNSMRMRIQVQEMFTMMNTMMKNHAKVVSNRQPLKYFTVQKM